MKKIILYILIVLLSLSVLTACGREAHTVPSEEAIPEKPVIVTTIFPVYDWIIQILGEQAENVEVDMLLDSGVDLHSYQPTVDDIIKLSTCDLFIYIGGESDAWVDDALTEATNQDMLVLDLLDALGDRAKEEETVEGMEAEQEEDSDETEYDEHIWLSLKNAVFLIDCITQALETVDSGHAEGYRSNAAAYREKLTALDTAYEAAVKEAAVKTLLFGDRFPFRYLADDYGLDYYAAFAGCSAETEASFETIVFLANKVDELGLNAICQIESSDGSIARTVRENTKSRDQEIVSLDSMQSTTSRDVENGASYLGLMEQNLTAMKAALR